MTHNIQVTILAMAPGITWGVGTLMLLFCNGVILGAVADGLHRGEARRRFWPGWLLPHGSVEIPAILLGGQAGFILAGALIGWGGRDTARRALARRRARPVRDHRAAPRRCWSGRGSSRPSSRSITSR